MRRMRGPPTETVKLAPRAIALDYNGTLSDDEALLEGIYLDVLAEAGAPIDAATYRAHLLGLPDHKMVLDGLRLGGMDAPPAEVCGRVLAARRERYRARVAHQPTISPDGAAFVRAIAKHMPVAVVSGAFRSEVEAGLAAAEIDAHIALIVAVEDVGRGKPDPDPYRFAVQGLRAHVADLAPREVLAIEDAAPGVASAEAAGLRTASLVPGIRAEVELAGLSTASAAQLV